jgi:hypothetical protein
MFENAAGYDHFMGSGSQMAARLFIDFARRLTMAPFSIWDVEPVRFRSP